MKHMLLALALVSPAEAEPIQITRVAPQDEAVCSGKDIIVVKCTKKYQIMCSSGHEVQYYCSEGAPVEVAPVPRVSHRRVIESGYVPHQARKARHKSPKPWSLFDVLFHHK